MAQFKNHSSLSTYAMMDHGSIDHRLNHTNWSRQIGTNTSASDSDSSIDILCSNDGIYNVTNLVPIDFALVMYGAIMPFLVAITILSNTLIIVILTRRHMRTPTNLVLLWLAVADLLTLMAPAPLYFYMYTLGYHTILPHGSVFCYIYNAMAEHVPMLFHTTSIWLTILLAGQRYIYICHPTIAKTLCTVPKVNRAIFASFVAALSTQLSRFFDTQFQNVDCQLPATIQLNSSQSEKQFNNLQLYQPACTQRLAWWLTWPDIYFPLYYGFRIVFVNLGPCIALVILNVLLFHALQKAKAKRKKLLQNDIKLNLGNQANKKKKRNNLSNSTTYMLIVVVSVFLLVEIPMAIATLVHMLANMNILQFEGDAHLHYLKMTIIMANFIIMLSFPLNFAIYCGMSAQFRNTFKTLFSTTMGCVSPAEIETATTVVSLAVVGDGPSSYCNRHISNANVAARAKQNGNHLAP